MTYQQEDIMDSDNEFVLFHSLATRQQAKKNELTKWSLIAKEG